MHYSCWLTNRSCARVVIAGAMVMACQSLALAMINLRFTPADLVRGSAQVAVVELTAPKNHRIAVKVTEMIKGDKLPENALIIDTADAPNATLQELKEILGNDTATKALVLTSRIKVGPGLKNPAAMLCVGTKWFALFAEADRYRLDKDPKDFDAIWAGGARSLTMAARAVGKDPGLNFPVKANPISTRHKSSRSLLGISTPTVVKASRCFTPALHRSASSIADSVALVWRESFSLTTICLRPRRTTKNLRPPPA